jgi:hypothetical protein
MQTSRVRLVLFDAILSVSLLRFASGKITFQHYRRHRIFYHSHSSSSPCAPATLMIASMIRVLREGVSVPFFFFSKTSASLSFLFAQHTNWKKVREPKYTSFFLVPVQNNTTTKQILFIICRQRRSHLDSRGR